MEKEKMPRKFMIGGDGSGTFTVEPLTKNTDELYESYSKGREDAWEAARKLEAMTMWEIERTFPDISDTAFICNQITAKEAIENLKDYELKANAIRLFDEVRWDYPEDEPVFIVTQIEKDKSIMSGITLDGQPYMDVPVEECHRTGKHFDNLEKYFKLSNPG